MINMSMKNFYMACGGSETKMSNNEALNKIVEILGSKSKSK